MGAADRGPNRSDGTGQRSGAVLVLNADRGPGPELARALAAGGLTVVLHSMGGSAVAGELLQEIVEAGGRAAEVDCGSAAAPQAAEVLAALAAVVGPVTTVVVNPRPAQAAQLRSPIGLEPGAVAAAENACTWSRAVTAALGHPSEATIIGLLSPGPPSSVREAVPRSLWQGLLRGLRRELAPRGARVVALTISTSGEADRERCSPQSAAARILRLTRRTSPAPTSGRSDSRAAPSPTPAPTVARWAGTDQRRAGEA